MRCNIFKKNYNYKNITEKYLKAPIYKHTRTILKHVHSGHSTDTKWDK